MQVLQSESDFVRALLLFVGVSCMLFFVARAMDGLRRRVLHHQGWPETRLNFLVAAVPFFLGTLGLIAVARALTAITAPPGGVVLTPYAGLFAAGSLWVMLASLALAAIALQHRHLQVLNPQKWTVTGFLASWILFKFALASSISLAIATRLQVPDAIFRAAQELGALPPWAWIPPVANSVLLFASSAGLVFSVYIVCSVAEIGLRVQAAQRAAHSSVRNAAGAGTR